LSHAWRRERQQTRGEPKDRKRQATATVKIRKNGKKRHGANVSFATWQSQSAHSVKRPAWGSGASFSKMIFMLIFKTCLQFLNAT
jgi:hypothetical protein